MTQTAFLPDNVPFKIGNGATPTESFVAVANAKSIGFSGAEAEEIDVTTLTSGGVKEFIQGLRDSGQMEIGLWFNPDEVTHFGTRGVWQLYKAGTVFNWEIPIPLPSGDTATISGTGFIKSEPLPGTINPNSPFESTVTIRRTGDTELDVA